jgi:hypothetical protein
MTVRLRDKGVLEPDEKVVNVMNNLTVPAWIFLLFGGGLLLAPYQLQKSSLAVLTDKHIYVLKGVRKVVLKAPLGELQCTIEGKAFPGRCLVIGDQKLWLPIHKTFRERGYAIAAAASAPPVGEPEATAAPGATVAEAEVADAADVDATAN